MTDSRLPHEHTLGGDYYSEVSLGALADVAVSNPGISRFSSHHGGMASFSSATTTPVGKGYFVGFGSPPRTLTASLPGRGSLQRINGTSESIPSSPINLPSLTTPTIRNSNSNNSNGGNLESLAHAAFHVGEENGDNTCFTTSSFENHRGILLASPQNTTSLYDMAFPTIDQDHSLPAAKRRKRSLPGSSGSSEGKRERKSRSTPASNKITSYMSFDGLGKSNDSLPPHDPPSLPSDEPADRSTSLESSSRGRAAKSAASSVSQPVSSSSTSTKAMLSAFALLFDRSMNSTDQNELLSRFFNQPEAMWAFLNEKYPGSVPRHLLASSPPSLPTTRRVRLQVATSKNRANETARALTALNEPMDVLTRVDASIGLNVWIGDLERYYHLVDRAFRLYGYRLRVWASNESPEEGYSATATSQAAVTVSEAFGWLEDCLEDEQQSTAEFTVYFAWVPTKPIAASNAGSNTASLSVGVFPLSKVRQHTVAAKSESPSVAGPASVPVAALPESAAPPPTRMISSSSPPRRSANPTSMTPSNKVSDIPVVKRRIQPIRIDEPLAVEHKEHETFTLMGDINFGVDSQSLSLQHLVTDTTNMPVMAMETATRP